MRGNHGELASNLSEGEKTAIAFVYFVTKLKENGNNIAPQSFIDYDSEYHYIFKKLYEYKVIDALNLDNSFLIANLSRKLLESFLAFKFPKSRNDFYQLLEEAFSSGQVRKISGYSGPQIPDSHLNCSKLEREST